MGLCCQTAGKEGDKVSDVFGAEGVSMKEHMCGSPISSTYNTTITQKSGSNFNHSSINTFTQRSSTTHDLVYIEVCWFSNIN